MDRDQQSRRQKSGMSGHAASRPKNRPQQRPRQAVPPKRGLGSRVGIEKRRRGPEPSGRAQTRPAPPPQPERRTTYHSAASGHGGQAPRTVPPRTRYRPGGTARRDNTAGNRNPQSAAYRQGAPRHRRRVTQVEKMRIRRRRKIIGILCVLAALAVGIVLSVNLLFKVTDFRIENTDRTTPANTGIYTEQQILDLLGVQKGDNLFGFSTRKKSEELQAQLPYLDVVQVDIQMPGTVVIKVQPATERFAIETPAGWLVLSDGLKVLRTDTAQPEGLILLDAALDDRAPLTAGSYLSLKDGGTLQATAETAPTPAAQTAETARAESRTDTVLRQLMSRLEEHGLLDGVTMISVRDLEEISVLYQGRVSIVLGTANNMDYKLRIAAQVVLDVDGTGLASTDKGTLDVSYQRSDGSIVGYFAPAEPSPSPTPEPTPTPVPEDGGGQAADAEPTPEPEG